MMSEDNNIPDAETDKVEFGMDFARNIDSTDEMQSSTTKSKLKRRRRASPTRQKSPQSWKSKTASPLKQTTVEQVYCICRSTDSTGFMIACDSCDQWYHGHCIGINESESKQIEHYYCNNCIAALKVPSGLKQCFGPVCQKAARPNSKYCSDECGIALASARLHLILPSRIDEWSHKKPVADESNDREIIEIKKKQQAIQKRTQKLQAQRKSLDDHIGKVETIKFDLELEEDVDEEEEWGKGLISCVSCGKDVVSKEAIKHMEKCYNKFEAQISFGSKHKTIVEGPPLICDFLDPSTQRYCKRLAVLCDEHNTKGPKSSRDKDNEIICGCPLQEWGEQQLGEHETFCHNAKKTCKKHYAWEKLRHGDIDMERIRMYLKMDELYEQERRILQAKHDRGGVMGLLLNSTFDHQLNEEMRQQQQYENQEQKAPNKTKICSKRTKVISSSRCSSESDEEVTVVSE